MSSSTSTSSATAMSSGVERKLTTLLAADAEGYSRAMDTDEVSTLADLRAARTVFNDRIARHHGRLVNTAGDGLLAEFGSVVEAVQCAIGAQRDLAGNGLRFRIGVHLGDVMVEDGDLFGEGVNLAARLQGMAEPGGILVSQQVYDQVRGKLPARLEYLGRKQPKNFADDVAVFRVNTQTTTGNGADEAKPPPRDVDFDAVPPDRPEPPADQPTGGEQRRGRGRRLGPIFGVIAGGLGAIDLATGPGLWFHWPALGLATAWALHAVPAVLPKRGDRFAARAGIIVLGLALVNLFSWSGYPWAVWPAGALLLAGLLRRFWSPAR